jgi:serine/threonine-protein kinase
VIGESVLHYRVLQELGKGGMGVVYKALDTKLERPVALKFLPHDRELTPQARARFLKEARATSALNHPSIVSLYDIAEWQGQGFLVMEFVEGRLLSEVIPPDGLPLRKVLQYAAEIAGALAAAHAAGIVHRDLKPGNVMIKSDERVKLLDFGLAKRTIDLAAIPSADVEATQSMVLTEVGWVAGTPAYMSPEQAVGDPVSAASDQFSFGILLYEMLTGLRPFRGSNRGSVLREVVGGEPPELKDLPAKGSPALAVMIVRMLRKNAAERYPSMSEVVDGIRDVQREQDYTAFALAAQPAVPAHSSGRRLHYLGWAAVAVIAIAGVAGLLNYRNAKQPASATGSFDAALRPHELFARGIEKLKTRYRPNSLEEAIRTFEEAQKRDPNYAPAYAGASVAYYWKRTGTKDPHWLSLAKSNAEAAATRDDSLALSHIASGLVAQAEGNSAKAERLFERALELDPKSAEALVRLGALASEQKRNKEAEPLLLRAHQSDPVNWEALTQLGLIHYREGDYTKAASWWEKWRDATPDSAMAYRNLAAAYHGLDRYDDAASALQKALEIQPNASAYSNLGTLVFYQGRYAEAVGHFKKTIDLGSNSYMHWGNYADACRWSPQHKQLADEAYQRAIQLARTHIASNPNDDGARSSLALYLAKSGKADESKSEIAKLAAAAKQQPETYFEMAVASEILGNRQGAMAFLGKAVAGGYTKREIEHDPELVSLRSDTAYHRLMARTGK